MNVIYKKKIKAKQVFGVANFSSKAIIQGRLKDNLNKKQIDEKIQVILETEPA